MHKSLIIERYLLNAAILSGGATLLLYYILPIKMAILGFSAHVVTLATGLVIILTGLLLRTKWRCVRADALDVVLLVFCIIMLLATINAPREAHQQQAITWTVSILAYVLLRNTFAYFSHRIIDVAAHLILLVWSSFSIAQVTLGKDAYVSGWMGIPQVTIYATGMTIYSNYAAITLVPLLVWVLVHNLVKQDWRRTAVWFLGCAALYCTMSRAGWLSLLVAVLVLSLWFRGQSTKLKKLIAHISLLGTAYFLVWVMPTQLDNYEPMVSIEETSIEEPSAQTRMSLDDYSIRTRFVTLQVALEALIEHPITGIGLGRFPEYYMRHRSKYINTVIDTRERISPHNGYAQLASESGLVALFAITLWLMMLFRRGFSTNPSMLALNTSLIGIAVWLVFHDGLYDRQFWLLAGCLASMVSKNDA